MGNNINSYYENIPNNKIKLDNKREQKAVNWNISSLIAWVGTSAFECNNILKKWNIS